MGRTGAKQAVISANTAMGPFNRNSRASAPNTLAPAPIEYVFVLAATLLAAVGRWIEPPLQEAVNLAVPVVLAATMLLGMHHLLRSDRTAIWTPLLWNRIAIMIYFCFGNLVPYVVDEVSRKYIEVFFLFQPQDVADVNLITAIFMVVYLSTCTLLSKSVQLFFGKSRLITVSKVSMETMGLLFLIFGGIPYFLGNLGFLFGLNVLANLNFLSEISRSVYVGILLLTIQYYDSDRLKFLMVASFVAILSFLGVFELNKSSVLFPVLVFSMGVIYKSKNVSHIVMLILFAFGLYSTVSGPISYARVQSFNTTNGFQGDKLFARGAQLLSYYGSSNAFEKEKISETWIRISYINGAAFAVYQYDNGNPGDSWKDLAVVWIPRALYPNKPIITDVARDFSYIATGNDVSQATPGLIAEAYWNQGWLGVVLVAILTGIISTFWSVYSITAMQRQAWHLFPIVLLGMRMGTRFDGMLAPDIFGPLSYAVIGHFALQFLNSGVLGTVQNARSPQLASASFRSKGT